MVNFKKDMGKDLQLDFRLMKLNLAYIRVV